MDVLIYYSCGSREFIRPSLHNNIILFQILCSRHGGAMFIIIHFCTVQIVGCACPCSMEGVPYVSGHFVARSEGFDGALFLPIICGLYCPQSLEPTSLGLPLFIAGYHPLTVSFRHFWASHGLWPEITSLQLRVLHL